MRSLAPDTIELLREMGFPVGDVETPKPVVQIQAAESTVAEVLAEETHPAQRIVEMVRMSVDGQEIDEDDVALIRYGRIAEETMSNVVEFVIDNIDTCTPDDIRNLVIKTSTEIDEAKKYLDKNHVLGEELLSMFLTVAIAGDEASALEALANVKDSIAAKYNVKK